MKLAKLSSYPLFDQELSSLSTDKMLINTLNAHSFNVSQNDLDFNRALMNSDVLIPDGVGVVWGIKLITSKKLKKIAGADLFFYEMERLEKMSGKCFFLGSTDKILETIKGKIVVEYPHVAVCTYSPPYKAAFTEEENAEMLAAVNKFEPDTLFIGMTAPKQEKWAYQHFTELKTGHICSIGAVFDFYAGTINRAPQWMIDLGLEWLYRLLKEPKRMWTRYLIGNWKFSVAVIREKIKFFN